MLTLGQAYQISLQLEMPDSPANQELGMFMIKLTCFSQDGGKVASSARSVSATKRSMATCVNNQTLILPPVIYYNINVCFSGNATALGHQLSLCEYSSDAQ